MLGITLFKNKKKTSLNLGSVLCLIAAVYFICSILILDPMAPISISSFSFTLNHWIRHWHVLAVALLPVYIALMIFGAAVVGIYFGSLLHRVIVNLFDNTSQ